MPSQSGLAEYLKQIDSDSWLIGNNLVLHRKTSAEQYLWKDNNDGSCYVLSVSPTTSEAHRLPPDGHVRLVHNLGTASAVWSFGDGAFLKLTQQKISFNIPKVLYQARQDGHSILLLSRVPGTTLDQAWRAMSADDKQFYLNKVAAVCKELSSLTSSAIQGVDGNCISDTWLDVRDCHDFRPEALRASCEKMGMDCGTFVFSHNDLAPSNILVDSGQKRGLGIIDWEMAGYVPPAWIRTKFAVSWGLNFEWHDVRAGHSSLREWRERVQQELGRSGFQSVEEAWMAWFKKE
ncbi:kinase-like domain-containing protein [Xylariaceae sp. FL0594]|nr:kinase-like domain-containing protein [Xylariaceae sp. FL0594]